jgi:hypothetical protein
MGALLKTLWPRRKAIKCLYRYLTGGITVNSHISFKLWRACNGAHADFYEAIR